ncbi:hypothetical protein MMC24_004022 [Lignoscripta atroalba]|nr:hypothetical protein [Lignoscripta atroalba]
MSATDTEPGESPSPFYRGFKPRSKMSWIWRKTRIWTWVAETLIAATFLFIFVNFAIYQSRPRGAPPFEPPDKITALDTAEPLPFDSSSLQSHLDHLVEIQEWQRPANLKVVALVFFGRRRYVSVLNCYLQRNLVDNGGLLDEIIFVVKTGDEDDLQYLEELLQKNPKYSSYDANGGDLYSGMWDVCEKGVMYVKIDDDVLFIEDSAIHSIVKRKFQEPDLLLVSGNIVVQPAFAWVHYHMGAIYPYLPEYQPATPEPGAPPFSTWRPSELPLWNGPDRINFTEWEAPPHHRWLPLPSGVDTDQTPITSVTYDPHGPGLLEWTIAAQQHYSFLENLEKEQLWKYKFESWDFKNERFSINFFAVMGDDIVAMKPLPPDDEAYLTIEYPKKTGRHAVMDGHGVAVHFSFRPMRYGTYDLETTDLLDRYRAYAEENICIKQRDVM